MAAVRLLRQTRNVPAPPPTGAGGGGVSANFLLRPTVTRTFTFQVLLSIYNIQLTQKHYCIDLISTKVT